MMKRIVALRPSVLLTLASEPIAIVTAGGFNTRGHHRERQFGHALLTHRRQRRAMSPARLSDTRRKDCRDRAYTIPRMSRAGTGAGAHRYTLMCPMRPGILSQKFVDEFLAQDVGRCPAWHDACSDNGMLVANWQPTSSNGKRGKMAESQGFRLLSAFEAVGMMVANWQPTRHWSNRDQCAASEVR
ncbi:hypothetical protein [Bifidobacterium jacchi]|uniref:Uncharacterized protein n=1 Tax=Bifidobacterium jacchi TaxID=2490545 RepID=A0A5N5RJ45_9BIFI|nr:hypothetical protein [Bifidobacterium jacchi]KAB5607129.1 hypothetical protein EHS19_05560 [Bifidobacterium jacchi]